MRACARARVCVYELFDINCMLVVWLADVEVELQYMYTDGSAGVFSKKT